MKKFLLGAVLLTFLLTAGCSTEDVTSYELRQPPGSSISAEVYTFWLPGEDGTLQAVSVDELTIEGSMESAVQEISELYQDKVRETGMQLPDGLELLNIRLEEVHTARHYNKTWVLEFSETLFELPEADQRLFLTGLTKTLIEGNPAMQHQTNFTSTRIMADGRDVGSYNVFHT